MSDTTKAHGGRVTTVSDLIARKLEEDRATARLAAIRAEIQAKRPPYGAGIVYGLIIGAVLWAGIVAVVALVLA
jgi:hypothetical protein